MDSCSGTDAASDTMSKKNHLMADNGKVLSLWPTYSPEAHASTTPKLQGK